MHITIYQSDPKKASAIQAELRRHLPASYQIDDQADETTRYLVAWMPPKSLFEAAPNVKACFSLGAGVDHLLKSNALPPDVPIYRLEDAGMGDQMARYCRHETEHFRLLCWRYQQQQRQAQWVEHEPAEPGQVKVGLLGYGVLGQQVADLLRSDGYQVSAFRRSKTGQTSAGVTVFAGESEFDAFLEHSQVLIVIAPLTDQTRGIVNRQSLSRMPKGGWVINVARGELVVEQDLLDAIGSEQLAGASLDVFATEPLPADHPYWSQPNIRITPHVAALTRTTESAQQIAGKILSLEKNDIVSGRVERDLGY